MEIVIILLYMMEGFDSVEDEYHCALCTFERVGEAGYKGAARIGRFANFRKEVMG